jgi:hypothetical protein
MVGLEFPIPIGVVGLWEHAPKMKPSTNREVDFQPKRARPRLWISCYRRENGCRASSFIDLG